MKDEMFRLTPVDVRRMEFPKAMRGYDAGRVDDFREQVADELERLTRANQELETSVKTLTDQLRGFRDRDKALNDALVSAQQLRAEVREQSEREAQIVLRDARSEAERIVQTARSEAVRFTDQLALLARMRRGYLKQFRVTVHAVERFTGLEFFRDLPKRTRDKLNLQCGQTMLGTPDS